MRRSDEGKVAGFVGYGGKRLRAVADGAENVRHGPQIFGLRALDRCPRSVKVDESRRCVWYQVEN